jgi:hypothetical protein
MTFFKNPSKNLVFLLYICIIIEGTGREAENETGNTGHNGYTGFIIYNQLLHDTGTEPVIDPTWNGNAGNYCK